jgi:hypothetical protein
MDQRSPHPSAGIAALSKEGTEAVDSGVAGKREVRFSFASSEEDIQEAAQRLG